MQNHLSMPPILESILLPFNLKYFATGWKSFYYQMYCESSKLFKFIQFVRKTAISIFFVGCVNRDGTSFYRQFKGEPSRNINKNNNIEMNLFPKLDFSSNCSNMSSVSLISVRFRPSKHTTYLFVKVSITCLT